MILLILQQSSTYTSNSKKSADQSQWSNVAGSTIIELRREHIVNG